ncbi:hypothetical protein FNV43_RR10453 [Rhamnella rubrinervis]|uniref:Uncharacterized protein n=1 Tax=Rhamnella rubrinervis TaxID=2594499 RepID=A0A8K0MKW1_9ROSA|nr:hypothetical protein FNV43_RR10453 [Rhamnella rubrinervis]
MRDLAFLTKEGETLDRIGNPGHWQVFKVSSSILERNMGRSRLILNGLLIRELSSTLTSFALWRPFQATSWVDCRPLLIAVRANPTSSTLLEDIPIDRNDQSLDSHSPSYRPEQSNQSSDYFILGPTFSLSTTSARQISKAEICSSKYPGPPSQRA